MNMQWRHGRIHAGRKAARAGPRPGISLPLGLAVVALGLSSCLGQLEIGQQQPVSCSTRRLDLAAGLYERAKEMLETHFVERRDDSLVMAYYMSRDAEDLSKTIRGCDDFNRAHKERAIGLIRANRLFRRILLLNMRDPDPFVMINILGSRYSRIFKNDIQ